LVTCASRWVLTWVTRLAHRTSSRSGLRCTREYSTLDYPYISAPLIHCLVVLFLRSRIHDHGSTHAVIKVLHGKIKAYYFTTLHDVQQLGPPANLEKGDITWIDPENYQVHMLSDESEFSVLL